MWCVIRLLLIVFLSPALAWGQTQVINGNRVHAGWVNYGTTAGTATAYTLTFSPALAGYVEGQCFLFKPHLANTGAATLNVQGKGAKALKKLSGSTLVPLVAGDLRIQRLMQVCYDGTDLQLMGPVPDAGDAADRGIVCDGVTQVGAAIQALLDTVPLGTQVTLPGGSCLLNQTLTITRSIGLVGAGMDHTYLKQTVTNIPVVVVSVINVHITGMTLMHNTSPVAGGDGLIVRAPNGASLQSVTLQDVSASWNWRGFVLGCMAYANIAHVQALKNNSHGFEFLYEGPPGCGVDQWDILHASSTLNMGAGFFGHNVAYDIGIGPFFWNTTSFGNNQGGYVFLGSPGHPIHDLRFHNVLSSADNVRGIYLDTYGGSHLISNPWIELTGLGGWPIGFDNTTSVSSNTGHCLGVTQNQTTGVTITGGLYWNCAWSGVALYAPYSTMTGGVSMGNGTAQHADLDKRAGVSIGASGVHLSGHSFQLPGTNTLHYLHLAGTLTDVVIGVNSYAPDLPPSQRLSNQATLLAGARRATMVAGLTVQGPLQVQSANAALVLQEISDVGTPSWPQRRGQVAIADTATTATVTLTPADPDALYFVQLTPVATTGGAPVGANTITGVTKTAGSFTVAVATAPGAGRFVVYDWLVHR